MEYQNSTWKKVQQFWNMPDPTWKFGFILLHLLLLQHSSSPILEYFLFVQFQWNLAWSKVHIVGLSGANIFFLQILNFGVSWSRKLSLKSTKKIKSIIMLECRRNFLCNSSVCTVVQHQCWMVSIPTKKKLEIPSKNTSPYSSHIWVASSTFRQL